MGTNDDSATANWTALDTHDRRVLGVLVEKAKTTPDAYPLSLNALRTGCNQKSNRFPQMTLDEDQVEDALERLRKVGAATMVQSDSRVQRYRHYAYEWLGVDKFELAVMAELLLRGAQTLGELRGRAARMEPIPGMVELRPILAALVEKNLVVYLTPPGRGAVVTHNLYQPQQLEKVRREHGGGVVGPAPAPPDGPAAVPAPEPAPLPPARVAPSSADASRGDESPVDESLVDELLAEEVRGLRAGLAELAETTAAEIQQLRSEVEDLKQQLGV